MQEWESKREFINGRWQIKCFECGFEIPANIEDGTPTKLEEKSFVLWVCPACGWKPAFFKEDIL
jgi:hypothetical protein